MWNNIRRPKNMDNKWSTPQFVIVLSSNVLSNDKGNYDIVSSEIPLSLLLYCLVMCHVMTRGTIKLFQVNYPTVWNCLVICVE